VTDVITRTETLAPEPARALGALLGVPVPDLERDGLPLLWHWIYLLDRPAQSDLGPDGHAVRGTLPAPPGPGRRRMWAGGRVRTSGPLRCGALATRRSSVLTVSEKQGRSGRLTFVTVGHQVSQGGTVVISEEQDIVYREEAGPPASAADSGSALAPAATGSATTSTATASAASQPDSGPPAPGDASPVVPPGPGEWEIEVSPSLLFRFSALTYNAHRIHYDRDYARDVEGYPGLLTHGPLQALAMAEAARAAGGAGGLAFDYRLVSPLFDFQGLVVSATAGPDGATVTAVRDRHGRQTASGRLSPS
jgi:3-methylfumaryl-CoA hydratase